MNVKEIRSILDQKLSDSDTKNLIIRSISKDENVIPILMELLEHERKYKKEVYENMNVLLSKADVGLDNKKFNKDNFMQKEIYEFYKKYKDMVGHCFKQLKF
jgi:hypothetical protein